MEALRIILTQNSANYKKEETVTNKMTYPLPPLSTIIGALHNACNYSDYHAMDISIQGKYESMHKEAYTDYCFLNSTKAYEDRGILVKMKNSKLLSNTFDKVAVTKNPQGNCFSKGVTIKVINEDLIKEYRELIDLSNKILVFKKQRIDPVLNLIKKRKKTLINQKKFNRGNIKEIELINMRQNEIKTLEQNIKQRFSDYEIENYIKPFSRFKILITSLKYYEILNNIKLVIHVKSDIKTLYDIKNNIYNLKSIGRSEDFVEVNDVSFVVLKDSIDESELVSKYSAYIDYDLIKNDIVLLRTKNGIEANGTKYYLNKNYTIKNSKRIFEKKKVVYASHYVADKGANNLFFDNINNGDEAFIVNFL